jgi:hypothetical protein
MRSPIYHLGRSAAFRNGTGVIVVIVFIVVFIVVGEGGGRMRRATIQGGRARKTIAKSRTRRGMCRCRWRGGTTVGWGGGGRIANATTSILERIDAAERLVGEVDTSAIDRITARAKVVRADLEAAARARSKLLSLLSSLSVRGMGEGMQQQHQQQQQQQQQQADAKTISELHASMIELDGISAHLPALALLLVDLSTLHANAADFNARLRAAEGAASRMESTLTSVEGALLRMEVGWRENMIIVERNVDRLNGLVNFEK